MTGRHAPQSTSPGTPAEAACSDYRMRLGWPVWLDELREQVLLLAGEVLTQGIQAGSRMVVVDMPADLGSRVASVLWIRSLPAVAYTAQRLVYVHPYRCPRWCYLAVADNSRHFHDPAALPVPLLDVHVIVGEAVQLPLFRPARAVMRAHRPTFGDEASAAAAPAWVCPPPSGDLSGRVLPRLTAVLAAVHEVVAGSTQPSQ